MVDKLENPHKVALLTLLGLAREVSNPELKDLAGFTITGSVREWLNDKGLVRSERRGRSYWHVLTDEGRDRCAEELLADPPTRSGALGGAFYTVLHGLERYLRRENLRLADVFTPDATIARDDVESHIRTAYRKLARRPRDWVRLADLRPMLNGATRADVDSVLKEMSRNRRADLVPISNRKVLTEADHAAAIRIGSDDSHQIRIEES